MPLKTNEFFTDYQKAIQKQSELNIALFADLEKYFAAIQNPFKKSFESLSKQNNDWSVAFAELQKENQKRVELMNEHLINLDKSVRAMAESLANYIKDLDNNLRQLTPYLLEKGWYPALFEWDNHIASKCCELMATNCHEEIELIMCDFARTRIELTKKALLTNWPSRVVIINDAFEALSNGKYSLFVPVMLAQADGIACEMFGVEQFFSENTQGKFGKNAAFELITRNCGLELIRTIFEKAICNKSIIAKKGERASLRGDNSILNHFYRHEILHGESVDYPTEGNALRTVMLLDFLIYVYKTKKTAEEREQEVKTIKINYNV